MDTQATLGVFRYEPACTLACFSTERNQASNCLPSALRYPKAHLRMIFLVFFAGYIIIPFQVQNHNTS